ncbi:MAG: S8 family peptidase, partial [Thermoanaerobaculia bacterium]
PDEIERLRRDPRVRAISEDRGGEGALLESVPLVGADMLHAYGYDGKGVTVAVFDTGIDVTNPDFAGRIVAQQCFCDNLDGTGCCPNGSTVQSGPGSAVDDNGHGTHVSGILGSSGASAPRGVAPAVQIVAVKVMDADNSFRSFTQIYRALEWIIAKRRDVRVINMSFGSYELFSPYGCSSAAAAIGMQDIVHALRRRGVLITASSGNQGSIDATTMPSCMDEVIAVAATYDIEGAPTGICSPREAHTDQVACFANSSDAIDLVAPGAAITASRRGGGSITHAGTSMAAPHVAGAIALMLQVSGGTVTARQTEDILKATGHVVFDGRNGLLFPRLDVLSAVASTPRPSLPKRRGVRK